MVIMFPAKATPSVTPKETVKNDQNMDRCFSWLM